MKENTAHLLTEAQRAEMQPHAAYLEVWCREEGQGLGPRGRASDSAGGGSSLAPFSRTANGGLPVNHNWKLWFVLGLALEANSRLG